MESKIQELADKIYREGVEKGKEEAQRIVDEAREEANRIVKTAQQQAESIVADANKQAAETKDNTQSEIKLFTEQAVNALKSEIATLLTNQTVGEAVKGFVEDKEYLHKFIVAMAEKWSADEAIVIGTNDAEGLKKYFALKAKALLDKGVKIEQVNGKKALFTIQPADGSYKVNFGEEEFVNYFKEFLRPQLVEMLF
jgi:V/A-type H+-transporting ATPase subunit E